MELYTIENENLKVGISPEGAELRSLVGKDGIEYIWQRDPNYWKNCAPNIFPYVGRMTDGKYTVNGKQYEMLIHGIAPYSLFEAEQVKADEIVFLLRANEETLKRYPWKFEFRVGYALKGSTLEITYSVKNQDGSVMYFGLGGHPGFNVPLEQGAAFEDYRLRFSECCIPGRVGFTEKCFLDGTEKLFRLENGTILELRHDLFDEDAIVLHAPAREVTLEKKNGGHAVKVSFPGMEYLGIWHRPHTDAPYVCIEPWTSLPSTQDVIADFAKQKDLISLEAGKEYVNRWRITVA